MPVLLLWCTANLLWSCHYIWCRWGKGAALQASRVITSLMHCNEASQRPVYHYRIVMHHNGGQVKASGALKGWYCIIIWPVYQAAGIYDISLFLCVRPIASRYFINWERIKIIITKHCGKSESWPLVSRPNNISTDFNKGSEIKRSLEFEKYLTRVSVWTSTQKGLQNINLNFNLI